MRGHLGAKERFCRRAHEEGHSQAPSSAIGTQDQALATSHLGLLGKKPHRALSHWPQKALVLEWILPSTWAGQPVGCTFRWWSLACSTCSSSCMILGYSVGSGPFGQIKFMVCLKWGSWIEACTVSKFISVLCL